MGISVNFDKTKVDENVEAYISNNVSIFDHMAICCAVGSVSVSIKYHINNCNITLNYIF